MEGKMGGCCSRRRVGAELGINVGLGNPYIFIME